MKNNTPLESDEQITLVHYCKAKRLTYFAPMNENKQSFTNRNAAIKIEAKAKAMGKVKGTSDLIVMLPYKILFIELKRQKGSVTSKEQKQFIEKVCLFDYADGRVCKGAKEAIAFIEEYLR